jgi:hypothetical protein
MESTIVTLTDETIYGITVYEKRNQPEKNRGKLLNDNVLILINHKPHCWNALVRIALNLRWSACANFATTLK